MLLFSYITSTQSSFQLSVESNPGLLWFYITSHCDKSKKLTPRFQPIIGDLVTRVFPPPREIVFLYFEVLLASYDIFLCSDRL